MNVLIDTIHKSKIIILLGVIFFSLFSGIAIVIAGVLMISHAIIDIFLSYETVLNRKLYYFVILYPIIYLILPLFYRDHSSYSDIVMLHDNCCNTTEPIKYQYV